MSLLLSVDRIIQIWLNPCISIVKYKQDDMTLMWLFDKDIGTKPIISNNRTGLY